MTRIIAVLLCAVMFLQLSDGLMAFAAYDPTESIELSVPEALQDGGNHFFIREDQFQISEKSHDKLYIPIQRVGAVDEPAEVTLKIADFSTHYGVNYTARIRGEKLEPEAFYEGVAVVDIARYADEIEEVEEPDEEELGQAIHDAGGLDMVDTAGQTIGRLTANRVDENGEPIAEEAPEETPEAEAPEAAAEPEEETSAAEPEAQSVLPGEVEEIESEITGGSSPTDALRAARNTATGAVSDRQELEAPEELLPGASKQDEAAEEADLIENSYPGREYRLSYAAGETVKFLEITPKYDPAADGDCNLILMLKDEPLEYFIDVNFNDRPVVITDEDPRTFATVSMAAAEAVAENGSVRITVLREGRVNETVSVMLSSADGTAVQDEDYGGVGAKLTFPMGVMQRSVELPVGHGAGEKDFYVSITPVDDVQIGASQTRVVIPAAEAPARDAELMEDENLYTDPLNMQETLIDDQGNEVYVYNRYSHQYELDHVEHPGEFSNNGTNYFGRSDEDESEDDIDDWPYLDSAYVCFKPVADLSNMPLIYDGFHINYNFFTNWADGTFRVAQCGFYPNGSHYYQKNLYVKKWGDCSTKKNNVVDVRFGALTPPEAVAIIAQNTENHYSWVRDCHVKLRVNSVQFIKRSFTVMVDPADPLPFSGLDEQTEKDRVRIMTDGTNDSILNLLAMDTFTISKLAGRTYTRLKDVVAVADNGTEYSLSDYIVNNVEDGQAYVAGMTDSFTIMLDKALIQYLHDNKAITWDEKQGSYSGTIHVKPVFDYSGDVEVNVRESEFGHMFISDYDGPEKADKVCPTLLWDFNSDEAMNAQMGENRRNLIEYTGGKDAEGNSYYTFTATGNEPFVSMETPVNSVYDIQWVKVRAKNLNCASKVIELFACRENNTNVNGNTCTHIKLAQDTEWHEYIVNIPESNVATANAIKNANLTSTAWTGNINWIRLDAMGDDEGKGMKSGDQIQIDYMAFFPTQAEAEEFRKVWVPDGLTLLDPGTHTFHLGDRLVFREPWEKIEGMRAVGVGYLGREGSAAGTIAGRHDCDYYIDGRTDIELTRDYYQFWQVYTAIENKVCVQVPTEQLKYFNTDIGLFKGVTPEVSGDYTVYEVRNNAKTNELIELTAAVKSANTVPVWTIGADMTRYSGQNFYFYTDVTAEENLITLTADTGTAGHADYALSGSLYTATMNLATGEIADNRIPAAYAGVIMGPSGASTDEEGKFTLAPQTLVGGTTVRYLISYNGVTAIRETRIAPASAPTETVTYTGSLGSEETAAAIPVTVGAIRAHTNAVGGARFTSVEVEQVGVLQGILNVVELNGKELTVKLNTEPGGVYVFNEEVYFEHIKGVRLYFQSQLTGEIHGDYSTLPEDNEQAGEDSGNKISPLTWDPEKNVVILNIKKLAPEEGGDYGAGDVLMAQLITDKRTFRNEISGEDMWYDPVSTGIAVIADREYEPETFHYELDVPTLLAVKVDDDGNLVEGEHHRTSFGRFPFLGQISAAIKVFTLWRTLKSDADYEAEQILDDLEDMGDGELMMWNPLVDKQIAMTALVRINNLPYGGQRIMFAVVATTAVGSYKNVLSPFNAASYFNDMTWGFGNKEGSGEQLGHSPKLIHQDNRDPNARSKMKSEIGGPYGRFSLYVGIYFDFGYIEEVVDDGDRETHLNHDLLLMGAGGFIGGQVALGWTWQWFPFGVPMYLNIEGAVSATLFLGASANPELTLEGYNKTANHTGDDFRFQAELLLQGSLSATGGLGLYKTVGFRLTLSVGIEAGYNKLMPVWYPLATSWGFTTAFTITGGIDIVQGPICISYDFASFSWPLPFGYGFMQFAQQARRGTVLLTTLYTKIDDKNVSKEVKRTMWEKMLALGDAIDHYSVDEKQLKSMVNDLRDYGSKQGYLNSWECFYINTINQAGAFFDIWTLVQCTDWEEFWHDLKDAATLNFYTDDAEMMMARLEDDDRPSYGAAILSAAEASDQKAFDQADFVSEEGKLRISASVNSKWVANEGELMAAFGAVSSKQLMEDAIHHPNSQLMRLSYESGGVTRNSNQFLLVFLGQTENKFDGTHPDVLMYSIYDANNDTWTEPRQVQPDGIQDGKPCLVDAGDKLILTWASVSGKKYSAFKTFAAEKGLSIEEAALQYPIEAGKGQEIYVAEFSKASKTFGAVEQLTDDDFDDSYPQAVYDSASGDYIILYYKTAQDDALYDDPTQAILDTASASPDPEKTYSVLCYMVYNAKADKAEGYRDDSGTAADVPAGWVRNYLYAKEFDETMKDYADPVTGETTGLAGFLADYGGQRFLPSPIPTQEDPPISDLTVCEGYNGLAAFAFTADTDQSLETTDDRDLFVQFYRFSDHSTYVPVKVAGEEVQPELVLNGDLKTGHYEARDVVTEVNVGTPRLVRNGGSTWLFWREDGDSLKYLNISRLLKYKVLDGEDEAVLAKRQTNEDGGYYFDPEDQETLSREGGDHNVYAVRADGSFAIDAMTGKPYEPEVCTVDFGSSLTESGIHITDYEVISDEMNNLYVVWSDTTKMDENKPIVSCDKSMALELYATAKVAEEDLNSTDPENPKYRARWSKPYRLTRDNAYNDGMALALSDDGDLLIVHNQYRKLPIDTEEKLLELVASGEREVVNIDGEDYIRGSYYYDSPTSLMFTRFEPVGSVEATQFVFSDDTPVAGQTVEVTAIVENTGLTTANGFDVTFNECKDGVITKRILRKNVENPITVNTGKKATFEWTVPADGPDGYSIQAVISEKNGEGNYESVTTSSAPFVSAPAFELTLESCRQNGDGFDAVYTVANTGNKAAKEGTEANLYLQGLYGDLKEKYGVDDACLVREDISGLQPGEVRTIERFFTLPVSVFRYCGYDAVQAVVYDSGMNALEHTDHLFITLDEPLNLTLNGGQDVSVATGGTAVAPAVYESTLFMDMGNENATKVVYTVDDPSIAAVDDEGKVTGLSDGTTTLTATLMPSGRTKSVRVKVGAGCKKDESCPISKFNDAQPTAWYHDGIHWALEKGVMNGVGNNRFVPDASTTRAMIVTMLWRMEDEPTSEHVMTFKDVPAGLWYTKALRWAAEHEIVKGYSEEKFGPEDRLTREQLVTILERYAKYKGMDVSEGEKSYLVGYSDADKVSDWAVKAFRWAVNAGIINGVGSSCLSPQTDATRAQAATMLMRFDELPKGAPARRSEKNTMQRATK